MRRQGSYLDVAPGTPQSSRVIHGYQIEKELLGVGSWAEVRRAVAVDSGKRVAVKMILKSRLSPSDRKLMSREIQVHTQLDHPNLCKLYHACETDEHILIFMELFETDLFNLGQSQPKVVQKNARRWFAQLLSAVQYMHSKKGIVHRDIKLENVLVSADHKRVALTDFGLADYCANQPFTMYCGSPAYASPELIHRTPYNGTRSDTWALGVLLYSMLSGKYPFEADTIPLLYKKILSPEDIDYSNIPKPAEKLIARMLTVDASARITLSDAASSSFLHFSLSDSIKSALKGILPAKSALQRTASSIV